MEKDKEESNIIVAVRIRPLNVREIQAGEWDVIRTQDNMIIVLDPIEKQFQHENRAMLGVYHRSKQQKYAFDRVFREESGEEIYNETVRSLIRTVVQGRNATVFAYGPTGSGKTHTMLGNQQIYGLNVLAIADIFELIEEDQEHEYSVVISYVQIYNEMIRDLLVPSPGYLQLRDDAERGLVIAGVTQFKAESTEQVMQVLLVGNRRRTTEATNANQTSSRSHAVFQVLLQKRPKTRAISVQTLIGKLSLIDLAGSERGTVTQNRGIRLMEGAKINRSLLALANVINALGDKNKKGFFVPYRDSKLTRLLKDSLGGNCKTTMITCISPASTQFQETINSLKYANRAKNIKTRQITNKQLVSIHISEYKSIITDLRVQIEQLKMKLEGKGQEPPQVPIHSGHNSFIKKQGHMCSCGRMQESQEIKRIKIQIFQNFNERIQLRRALMEIDEQNALNVLQIKRKKMALEQNQSSYSQGEGGKIAKEISTLKLNTRKNLLKKEITELQLQECMGQTKRIRDDMNLRIRTKQNRDFLQIIIKNHILELQNIELEINLEMQEKTIAGLEGIAREQSSKIEQHGLKVETQDIVQNQEDIELQIEQEEEGDHQGNLQDLDEEENQERESSKKIPRSKGSAKMIKIQNDDYRNEISNNGQGVLFNRQKLQEENERGKGGGLQFNLKGVNFKLAEKMPVVPRRKK